MKSINERLHKIFKWDLKELLQNIFGLGVFCVGINLFVEPCHLYSGGILGLSQLINRLVNDMFNLNIYLTGILYLLINIPLLIMAYHSISKSFCARTLLTIGFQTILLNIIPIPEKALVADTLTNVLIGGTLVGIGIANILSATGSTGGTDIIGIILTSKNKNFSVGKFALGFNTILYCASGILYGVPIMIYSIMYSIVENLYIDRLHDQNVSSCVTIFTKQKPRELLNFIEKDLNRGATSWIGTGEYDKTKTYITYVALSRYELHKLEKYIKDNHEDVFLTKSNFLEVYGEFAKRLSK